MGQLPSTQIQNYVILQYYILPKDNLCFLRTVYHAQALSLTRTGNGE